MKVLVLFDFDGTLTKKDTMFEFIKFTHGRSILFYKMILMLPTLVKMKLGMVSNASAKLSLLSSFYKGWPQKKMHKAGEDFFKSIRNKSEALFFNHQIFTDCLFQIS